MRAVPGGFLKENLGLTVHKFNVNVNVVSIAVECWVKICSTDVLTTLFYLLEILYES